MFNKCYYHTTHFNTQGGLVILRTKAFKCEFKVLKIWIGLLRSGLRPEKIFMLSPNRKAKGSFSSVSFSRCYNIVTQHLNVRPDRLLL